MTEPTPGATPPLGEGEDAGPPPRTPIGALLIAGLLLAVSGGVLPASAILRIVVPLAALLLVDGYLWFGAGVVVLGLGAGSMWFAQQHAYLQLVLLNAFGLGGVAMAIAVGRGFGPFVVGLVGAAPAALVSVGLFLTDGLGFRGTVEDILLAAVAAVKTAGYMPPQFSNALPTFQDLWMRFYPVALVIVLLCSATAVFLLAEVLIPLLGRPALPDGRFRHWRLPSGAVWLLFAGVGMALAQQGHVQTAGLNLALVMVALYGGVGLAIVRYFLLAWGLPTVVQVCITTGLFVLGVVSEMPLVPAFAIALGLLDTWMDFRGLHTPRMHAGGERPT